MQNWHDSAPKPDENRHFLAQRKLSLYRIEKIIADNCPIHPEILTNKIMYSEGMRRSLIEDYLLIFLVNKIISISHNENGVKIVNYNGKLKKNIGII